MERVLSCVRDSKEPIDKRLYERFFDDHEIHDADSEWHPDDWSYTFISKKLSIMLYHYTDVGIHKTLAEAQMGCRLDAYRVMNKLMDPNGDDFAFSLQQSIMNVSKITVKTIHDELAAVKEVQARIREMDRRTGLTAFVLANDRDNNIAHEAQKQIYAGMVFVNVLTNTTQKYISQGADGQA